MNDITETQKIILAKLKYRDPDEYKSRLERYGMQESDILMYIRKEKDRREAINGYDPTMVPKSKGYTYMMGGKPYWSPVPVYPKINVRVKTGKEEIIHKESILVIVDGDNNIYKALNGIEKVRARISIQVFITDINLKSKLNTKYGLCSEVEVVESGPQAVDNRIKTIAGDQAKKHKYDKIVIVSHDQGYREKIREWKRKYNYKDDEIILCKYIKDVIN